jgi:hypothetical protein
MGLSEAWYSVKALTPISGSRFVRRVANYGETKKTMLPHCLLRIYSTFYVYCGVQTRCYTIGEQTNISFYEIVQVLLDYNNENSVFYVVCVDML